MSQPWVYRAQFMTKKDHKTKVFSLNNVENPVLSGHSKIDKALMRSE